MGLKKNVLYSGFLTSSLYVFQFITYPYVSRVLGVSGVGICNFAQTIVHYFYTTFYIRYYFYWC